MEISPVAAALETPPKSHKQLQILPSLKSKELDTISAQYTTLSAKSKGISPAATNPTNTVTNPNAITVHRRPRSEVIAEDTHQGHTPSLDVPKQGVPPQSKSQTSGFTGPAKEILSRQETHTVHQGNLPQLMLLLGPLPRLPLTLAKLKWGRTGLWRGSLPYHSMIKGFLKLRSLMWFLIEVQRHIKTSFWVSSLERPLLTARFKASSRTYGERVQNW